MHQTEALKADLSRGLEGEIAELRRHSPAERALELAVFPLLWIAGAALALAPLPSSPGAWRRGASVDRVRIVQEYALLGTVWTAAFALVPFEVLLRGWMIPLVVVAYMTQIRGFTQHGITDHTDPLLASRSIHPGPLVRFLVLNENYHLEHHLYPEIPSYNLRKLHLLLRDRLPRSVTGTSYSGFIARFLRATWRRDETPLGMSSRKTF